MSAKVSPADYPIITRGWLGPECDDGWNDILNRLFAKLEAEAKKYPAGEEPYLVQVKEKFGTLRVYMDQMNGDMAKAIAEAEEESARTCEYCGRPGREISRNGWIKVRCEECERNNERRRAEK